MGCLGEKGCLKHCNSATITISSDTPLTSSAVSIVSDKKSSNNVYILPPEWEMRMETWEEVAINLTGPWIVKVNNRKADFDANMCNDMASKWLSS
jgi:hypothetical protein